MPVTAIVGANWGDEGKGKITDLLAQNAEYVVRFQGGANAGHTIINQYGRFSLHLLPSGIFSARTTNIIGSGVAFDVRKFVTEIKSVIEGGVPEPKILVSDRVQLLNTVRRVSVCANKASNHIKFDLKQGQLEVSAQDLGFALAAYEKILCDYQGDELTIGFKSTFLTEILANMSCNTLVIKFADSRRAALLLPSEEEAESEKICGILMPIMIS